MSKTLLVPLDGSELDGSILPWAVVLARSRGFSIVLARVVPGVAYHEAVTEGARKQLFTAEQEPGHAYLERLRLELLCQGASVETLIRQGEPADVIADLAEEVNAFAIAMATHARSGLKRLLLGSVAEQVLRQASVPVLITRYRAGKEGRRPALTRLLVPLDGSPLAEDALAAVPGFAAPGAAVTLVRVVAPVERRVGSDEAALTMVDEKATAGAIVEAEEYLHRISRPLQSAHLSVQRCVRVGDAVDELLAVAAEQVVDLIVMATHGRTGPGRTLLGSVADQLVQRSDRPVVLVSGQARAAHVEVAGSTQGSL